MFDDSGLLVAVRIYWLYDSYSTLFLYDTENLDQDGDGELNAADLEKVKRGETEWPDGYEGDTYLFVNGEKQALSRPVNAMAEQVAGRIGVGFELRLQTPQPMQGRHARLKIYDPGYYYAYSVPGEGMIIGDMPGCRVWVERPDRDAEMAKLQKDLQALSREETPSDLNIGAKFAEDVVMQCD